MALHNNTTWFCSSLLWDFVSLFSETIPLSRMYAVPWVTTRAICVLTGRIWTHLDRWMVNTGGISLDLHRPSGRYSVGLKSVWLQHEKRRAGILVRNHLGKQIQSLNEAHWPCYLNHLKLQEIFAVSNISWQNWKLDAVGRTLRPFLTLPIIILARRTNCRYSA